MATSKVSIPKYISTKHATHFKNAFLEDSHVFHRTEISWPFALCFARQCRCVWRVEKMQARSELLLLLPTPAITETVNNPSLSGTIIHHSVPFRLPLLLGRSNVKYNKLDKSYFSPRLYGSWQGAL